MLWDIPGISFGMSHGGQVVMLDAKGVADIATGRPATPDATSYRCASITKTMTATLVMQQVEAGRMRTRCTDHHVCDVDPPPARCT